MKRGTKHIACGFFTAAALALSLPASANNSVHVTWHWHLHQPVYWPDQAASGHAADHYESAWDTIQQQNGGRPHPNPETVLNIFTVDDRIAAYQYRPRDSVSTVTNFVNAGAQVSYSGALIENVQSLVGHNVCGGSGCYNAGWNNSNIQARNWTTSGSQPRMDLVNFNYHHSLAPLISDETLLMELLIHRRQMEIFWTTSPAVSRGYFPSETCFTERMIPILKQAGIEWSVVGNTHLTRSCSDYPVSFSGDNCDVPNKADQINPAQGAGNYQRVSVNNLGCQPAAALPFAYQLHYGRYVNPSTGAASMLMLVPSEQALGYLDSEQSWNISSLGTLSAHNDPAKPALVYLAHDGDNAFSGGFTYYMSQVNSIAGQANSAGYEPTTVEQFINDWPPNSNDVVHVEDGGWVNNQAGGDFGSPLFTGWHWPPSITSNSVNVVDPSVGTSSKADVIRVQLATENRVKTAQQIQNTLTGYTNRIDQIRDPGSFSQTPSAVELGWHYYLGGLDSGFVYFGCGGDECARCVVSQSNAVRNVNSIVTGNPSLDNTPPTLFIPQRHPWNPGTTNFGAQYSYHVTVPANNDFWVWTYAYDASGITNVSLLYRSNGSYAPTQDQFKVYADGPNTGPWIRQAMTQRSVAPAISSTPQYIADYYYSKVTGLTGGYVDYYVSATDSRGNTYNSPIQHVFVGPSGSPTTPGTPQNVTATGAATNQINVSWTASSGATGYIVKRAGSQIATTSATTYSDIGLPASTQFCYTIIATNSIDSSAESSPSACATTFNPPPPNFSPPFVIDGNSVDSTNYLQSNPGMTIYAAVRGQMLYVATWSPGIYPGDTTKNDHFIVVTDQLSPMSPAFPTWSKAGTMAASGPKPFLSGESNNGYVGWQNLDGSAVTASNQFAKAPTNAGYMEGTINLAQAFGSMPSNIYVCAAAYNTTNSPPNGALVAQAPAGNGNGNIESNEFLMLSIPAITDNDGNGIYDRLEPSKDFVIQKIQPAVAGGFTITWASVPGKTYDVMYCDSLGGGWQSLIQKTAQTGEITLSHTDNTAGTQRFYKIRCVNP
jgi:hypothetical protein